MTPRETLQSIIELNSITYHETEADRFRRSARGHREKSDAALTGLGYATTAAAASLHPSVASKGAEYAKRAGDAMVGSSLNEGRIRGAISKAGRYARENPVKVFRGAAFAPAAIIGAGYAAHKLGAWRNDKKANASLESANELRKERNSLMQSLLADKMRETKMSAREELNSIISLGIREDKTGTPARRFQKKKPKGKPLRGLPPGSQVPGDSGGGATSLSARDRFNTILFGPDPRPRNSLGEFGGAEPGAPNPGAMRMAYQAPQAAAEEGGALKALAKKLGKVRK